MESRMPHWLTKQASLAPKQVAIEQASGEKITYAELEKQSKAYARKLASYEIKERDKVAILSPNKLEMIIAVYALTYLEATIVMLNTRLSQQELTYQLEQSETKLLLTTGSLQAEKALSFSQQVRFSDVSKQVEKDIPLVETIGLASPFTMMFTSGTTGNPKAVVHTYGNHYASAMNSALNLGLYDNDKWLLTLPIFHVGGLSILLRSLLYGIQVYFLPKYDAKIVFHALMKQQVTIISVVSLMLKELIDELGEASFPKDLRCILLGGGPVPTPLLDAVKEKSLPVFQTYGMTETSSQIATLKAEDIFEKIGSAGKPLFAAQLKIINEDEAGVGEIAVKGPMVMNGYYRNEAANKLAFTDDWLHTGDLGYLDADGYLYVVDRRTDLIISGGENIYPTEIENTLLQIDTISDAAVVGRQDAKWGQVPVAFIVCKEKHLSEAEIIEEISPQLASYKLPQEIYIVDQLPRNASNKIMRHKLAAKFKA